MTGHPLARGLLWIAVLVVAGLLLRHFGADEQFNRAWVDAEVRGAGMLGLALFMAVGILFTALGLPRQVVGFLAGYAFGFWWGTLLALLASLGGCLLTFYYARGLGRGWVARRFPQRVRRLDRFVGHHPLRSVLMLRLLPLGSNLATNLAAGVSSIRSRPFLLGSALGYLPQTLVFVLIGSGLHVDPMWRIGGGTLLFLLSALLGISLYRRYRRQFPEHGITPLVRPRAL